jgi:hypothetical protein
MKLHDKYFIGSTLHAPVYYTHEGRRISFFVRFLIESKDEKSYKGVLLDIYNSDVYKPCNCNWKRLLASFGIDFPFEVGYTVLLTPDHPETTRTFYEISTNIINKDILF